MLPTLAFFPHELLENIASNLFTNDQYNGLTVCKSWYLPFCRILYRHITITSRTQLKRFLLSTTRWDIHGCFVRTIHIGVNDYTFKIEDCVTGAVPLSSIQVGITSHELHLLITQLPRLTSLYFDPRLWHFINTCKVGFSNTMIQLPPLDHPRQLVFLNNQSRLRTLHLRGANMFQLHQENRFLAIFKSLSSITDLTIDGDGMWDTEHAMRFTINDIDTLHSYLPRLERLNITDSVHLTDDGRRPANDNKLMISTTQLEELTLFASIELVDVWCTYLGTKHPCLVDLNLKLTLIRTRTTTTTQNDNARPFARMLNKFHQLRSLKLHPSMSRQRFLDDKSFDKTTQELNHLEIGLWQPDAITTFKPHLLKATTHLVIPCWDSSIDLSILPCLSHLEIKCCSSSSQQHSEDKSSSTCTTTVAIDSILNACPVLGHLEIHWGTTTHLSNSTIIKHNNLKTLRFNHVNVQDTNVFAYLAMRCPQLEGLFLRECQGITEINMLNANFKYIVLSELSAEHLKLIQHQKLERHRKRRHMDAQTLARWYKSYQNQYTFQTYIARLPQEPESYLSVLCGSVDKLVFNGCKI